MIRAVLTGVPRRLGPLTRDLFIAVTQHGRPLAPVTQRERVLASVVAVPGPSRAGRLHTTRLG